MVAQHYTINSATGQPFCKRAHYTASNTMQELPAAVLQRLLSASLAARTHSHAPYSRYAVGAAMLDEHGAVHAGCNIENAAYHLIVIAADPSGVKQSWTLGELLPASFGPNHLLRHAMRS